MAKAKTGIGVEIILYDMNGDQSLSMSLLEAQKVSQILTACTALLAPHGYHYAEGYEAPKPSLRRQQPSPAADEPKETIN